MKLPKNTKSQQHELGEELEDLRHRGHRGGYIMNHRALLTSRWGGDKLLAAAGLSIVMFLGWLLTMKWVSILWGHMLSFWSEVLGMRAYVTMVHYRFGDVFSFSTPYLHFRSSVPDYVDLLVGAIVTFIVFVATFFLPRRHLPLIYFLRVVVFFHACAQLFFTFVPLSFPYGASGYVHGVLIAGLALIALIPIVLAFTYYIFDFSFFKKLGLTLLIMGHFTILIPLQFTAHAYVLYHTSLLMLPLLFFIFGLPLNVMLFIGFYSWGASWKNKLYEEPEPKANKNTKKGKTGAVVVALLLVPLLSGAVSAQEDTGPPLVKYLEVSAGYSHFTNDLGDGNDQNIAFVLAKEWQYQLRLDAGRAERWGDSGLGVGAMFTKYLAQSWSVGVGASTGGGDFIFPEYRIDATVGKALLEQRNLLVSLGYVHQQSKGENYFDRISASLTYYVGSHWILGSHFNYDIGEPGTTITKSGGLGATWYTWQRHYLGLMVEFGDINYTQVGVNDYKVAYEQFLIRGTFSEYLNPTMGINLKAEYGTNDLYEIYAVSVAFFKEW